MVDFLSECRLNNELCLEDESLAKNAFDNKLLVESISECEFNNKLLFNSLFFIFKARNGRELPR